MKKKEGKSGVSDDLTSGIQKSSENPQHQTDTESNQGSTPAPSSFQEPGTLPRSGSTAQLLMMQSLAQLHDHNDVTDDMRTRWTLVHTRFASMENSNWVAVYVKKGADKSKAEMSGYYCNLALIAALFGGFSFSGTLSMQTEGLEDWENDLIAMSGTLCFTFFFVTVMNCIFIDNALKQIPDDKFFLHFLTAQRFFLGIPSLCFAVGIFMTFVNFVCCLHALYGSRIIWFVILSTVIALLGILRRYLILKATMRSYAHANQQHVAMTAGHDGSDALANQNEDVDLCSIM